MTANDNETLHCHICGAETEWFCRDCGEPVCEDCCVPFTLQNQIDYTLCQCCYEGAEARRSLELWAEETAREKREKEKEAKRAARRIAARERYWRPENIEKRREAKRKRIEFRIKQLENTMRIVAEMFRK